jgi:hypothetical protein
MPLDRFNPAGLDNSIKQQKNMFSRSVRNRWLGAVERTVRMLTLSGGLAATTLLCSAQTEDEARIAEQRRYDAAIADFTAKMKAANYPPLFEKAAAEFNVPPDILKGVAFTLTRWEHLQWPPGENFSPNHGKPRPFGIMSLWSNDFFGMSLVEAANLIGKDAEELKSDVFQNMRGGAALLRKLYDETAKPEGTTADDIESWRYAMAEYVGIPEPDLKHRFALEVYEHMNKGFDKFGIEWKARPVNLGPMREEVKRLVAAEDAKRAAIIAANPQLADGPMPPPVNLPTATDQSPPPLTAAPVQATAANNSGKWWLAGIGGLLIVGLVLALRRQSESKPNHRKKL